VFKDGRADNSGNEEIKGGQGEVCKILGFEETDEVKKRT